MTDIISNAVARANASVREIRGPCDDPLFQAMQHERDELRVLCASLEKLNDELVKKVARLENRLAAAGVNVYRNEQD